MVGAFHRRSGISPCGIRLSRAGTAGRRGRNGMAGRADAVSTGGLNQVSRKGAKRNGRKAGSRIIPHKDTKRTVDRKSVVSGKNVTGRVDLGWYCDHEKKMLN